MPQTEKKRKMELTPEEKKRRSELAKSLHKEGKFGGHQKGAGRPKKSRAQETVADRIREEGEEIFRALKSALKSDSPTIKLKAALAMLEIETKEFDLQRKEEQRMYDNLDRAALLQLIEDRIDQLEKAGVHLPAKIIESTATEITDG